jgi:four helix bundle protein
MNERKEQRYPKVVKFEDLVVWQKSLKLSVDIYDALKDVRDFGLRDQMQRSSVSVPSNISEGFDRNTNKDFIRFLYIAKGSCSELRTQLYVAKEINLIPIDKVEKLIEQTKKVSAMLYKYIQTRIERF